MPRMNGLRTSRYGNGFSNHIDFSTTAVGLAPWLTTRSAPSGLLSKVAWRRDTRGDVMLPLRSPWRPSSTTSKSGSGVTRPARLRSESGGARSCCGGCRGVASACMAASLLVLWLRCGFTSRLAAVLDALLLRDTPGRYRIRSAATGGSPQPVSL